MPTVVDYDPEKDLFTFAHHGNVSKIWGITRVMTTRGMAWQFKGAYPGGIISLKDLKAIDPGCEATRPAIAKINELKSVPDKVKGLDVLTSSGYIYKTQPKPYQPEVIELMYHVPNLGLLLDRGLGKTYISLNLAALLKHLGEPYRMLVLGPKIVLKSWEMQARQHTNLSYLIFRGTPPQKRKLIQQIRDEGQPEVLITNYDTMVAHRGNSEFVDFVTQELSYDVLILDEFSKLSDPNAIRSKRIKSFAYTIGRRYGLSGTLSGGSPLDVYNPMTTLDSRIFTSNFWKFKNQFCSFSPYNRHIITGYRNLDKMKRRMDNFVTIKTKDDCLDLQPQLFADVLYEVSPAQRKLYNEVVKSDTVEVMGKTVHVSMAAAKITKMLQILSGFFLMPIERNFEVCNQCQHIFYCVEMDVYPWNQKCRRPGAKVKKPRQEVFRFKDNPKLEGFTEEILEMQEPLIVWAFFKEELRQLREVFRKHGVKYITPSTRDCDAIFQQDTSYQVFLGQVRQGIGITLTRATRTRYYSLTTSLTDYLQSLDRNYRIGQTKKVLVEHTYMPGAVDESLMHLLGCKQDVADFINTKAECVVCPELKRCTEFVIAPYSKGCVHFGKREAAETRGRLAYTTI